MVESFGELIWQYLTKLHVHFIFWPNNPTSRNLPLRYTFISTKMLMCMVSHYSVICNGKIFETTNTPVEELNKLWYNHTLEYYAALKN